MSLKTQEIICQLAKELDVDLDEESLNLIYKLLDSGIPPESLITILKKIQKEVE